MKVFVNGEPREFETELPIRALLTQLGHRPDGVAVAINLTFVPRSEHEDTRVRDGDDVEIVVPMQGG